LNKNSIDWLSNQADVNVFEAKRLLTESIVPSIKYRYKVFQCQIASAGYLHFLYFFFRSSLFEDTIRLTLKEADTLLNRGYFVISRFQSWDPVEVFKNVLDKWQIDFYIFHLYLQLSNGNTAVNLWNSSSIQKIPILYRRAIYFLGKNDMKMKNFKAKTFNNL
jgi:hypothetical protein